MAPRRALRPLVLALAFSLAGLAPAPARSAAWQAGDVEAAERYRALERERALRYRGMLEQRAGDRRQAAEPSAPAPRRDRAKAARPQRGGERAADLFEPWVERLAGRVWDVALDALESAARGAWRELRAWLEGALTRAGGETGRAQAEWRSGR